MKILVFDTETTGFINKKETDLEKQPKIIQFAWILWNINSWEFKVEKEIDVLINPKIPIPYQSSEVHHIYDIDVKGAPYIEDIIDDILYSVNTPDIIIWHNIEYDEEMIKLELKRLDKLYKYMPKQSICTMKTTVDFCKIQWNGMRFKYPRLWELHKKLFWEYFVWAHDALTDVKATLRCFLELKKQWVIEVEKKEDNKISLF